MVYKFPPRGRLLNLPIFHPARRIWILTNFRNSITLLLPRNAWLVALFLASSSQAADTLSAAPFAPLSFEEARGLSIEKLDLHIRGGEALFRLDIKNIANMSVRKKVGFHLPTFEWKDLSDDYFDKDFPELTVKSDARSIHPLPTTRALSKKKDVTSLLKQAGFDPLMVASSSPDKFPSNIAASARKARRLVDAGLFEERQGTYFPAWTVSVQYHWSQRFEKKSNTEISYKYRLRPGFGIARIDDDAIKKVLAENCGSTGEVQSLLTNLRLSPEFLLFEEFDIPLANPVPKAVNIEFTPQPLNETFIPLISFGCFNKNAHLGERDGAGFSAFESSRSSIKFVTVSYQKTESK